MKKFYAILSILLLLAACGESTEDTYTRGYKDGHYDGVEKVCDEIKQISGADNARAYGYCSQ